LSNGYFYGFPETANQGLKVAEHSGGTDIDDPLTDDRNPDQTDTARIEQFLSSHMPGVSNRRLHHEVCFYTMTPDAHFVIDRHPDYPQVAFAAGMSGHGFKFAPAIGRLLTELTLDGRSSADVEFLGLGRPGLLS
jgi:glycine/D-amino acid oxidase-like deaminating enzyme